MQCLTLPPPSTSRPGQRVGSAQYKIFNHSGTISVKSICRDLTKNTVSKKNIKWSLQNLQSFRNFYLLSIYKYNCKVKKLFECVYEVYELRHPPVHMINFEFCAWIHIDSSSVQRGIRAILLMLFEQVYVNNGPINFFSSILICSWKRESTRPVKLIVEFQY